MSNVLWAKDITLLVLNIVALEIVSPLIRPTLLRWWCRRAEARDDRRYGPIRDRFSDAPRPVAPIPIGSARARHRCL